jgi:hypothetical protein
VVEAKSFPQSCHPAVLDDVIDVVNEFLYSPAAEQAFARWVRIFSKWGLKDFGPQDAAALDLPFLYRQLRDDLRTPSFVYQAFDFQNGPKQFRDKWGMIYWGLTERAKDLPGGSDVFAPEQWLNQNVRKAARFDVLNIIL